MNKLEKSEIKIIPDFPPLLGEVGGVFGIIKTQAQLFRQHQTPGG